MAAAGASSASEQVSASKSVRPTAAERQEALGVIQQMKEMEPPLLPRRGQPPKPNVVACAIALHRGERFADDREAQRLFGVHPETNVRKVWVDGKLAAFAPAGLGVPGEPALPVYLLERDGDAVGASSSDRWYEMPSYVSFEAVQAKWQPSRASAAFEEEYDADDGAWMGEHLNAMAKREREFREWSAVHGAACEAQHAQLAADAKCGCLDYYWALEYSRHAQPWWQLRKAVCLEQDGTQTLGENELRVEEPVLRFRSFRPFMGNLHMAAQVFSPAGNHAWLDTERAKLEPCPTEATRPSVPYCIECGQHECECPAFEDDDPARTDMVGGDWMGGERNPIEEEVHQQQQMAQERQKQPSTEYANGPELDGEREEHERGCISKAYNQPWDQVSEGGQEIGRWLGSYWRNPSDPQQEVLQLQERQAEREREERMRRAGIPPPHRDDPRYGPCAHNSAGDEEFRADRAVWYEHVTGESLTGLDLTEQWQRVDRIARCFRADSRDDHPQPLHCCAES